MSSRGSEVDYDDDQLEEGQITNSPGLEMEMAACKDGEFALEQASLVVSADNEERGEHGNNFSNSTDPEVVIQHRRCQEEVAEGMDLGLDEVWAEKRRAM